MDPTAVMGKRIGAWFLDGIIAFVIFLAVFFAFGDSAETFFNPCGDDSAPALCFHADGTTYFAEGGNAAAVLGLTWGSGLLFGWLVQGHWGGTPGKLMVGLRVIDQKTGQLAGFGKSLGRTLLWVVDGIPFVLPLVGLITGVTTKGHRRVGDMAAGTLVVEKESVGVPPMVPGLTTMPGTFTAAPPMGAPVGAPIPPPVDAPPPMAPPAPAPAAAEPDGVSAPKWDADRNAYIQWDPELNAWMQFDEASQQWRPITS